MTPEQEQVLQQESRATLDRIKIKHRELKDQLAQSYAYVVFPALGRASLVLGGSYGRGTVFRKDKRIGYATLSQLTLGVQVGGQTYSELIFFQDENALETFKGGKVAFAANASAVIVKAAASGTIDIAHCTAHAYSRGGMLLEASLGGQKFSFMPPSSGNGAQAGEKGEESAGGEQGSGGGLQRLPARHPVAYAAGLSALTLLTRLMKVEGESRSAAQGSQ